ncbi:MAG: DUF748 domain-containing protein [Pseudomonadota bacterium]
MHWKKWGAGLAFLLAAYAALGFWVVPWALEREVAKFGQQTLARQASVGKVRFNPFTLRLQAENLKLAEADSQPLFDVAALAVQMQWRSIYRRAWTFSEVTLTGPSVNLLISPDGKFNLGELLATLDRTPRKPSADSSLPRLVIERFAMENGRLAMNDLRAGYKNELTPIEFKLLNFSTLPDQSDSHSFTAESARGGKLRWTGTASVNPIRASGEVVLEDIALPELSGYLKPHTHARMASGQLSAKVPYFVSYESGKLNARLAEANLSLRNLALIREGAAQAFTTLARLDVTQVNADLARRDASVGELNAGGGSINVNRNPQGELDLAQLMVANTQPVKAASGGSGTSTASTTAGTDWKLAVKRVALDDVAIVVVDQSVSPPAKLQASKAHLQFQVDAAQSAQVFSAHVKGADFSLADLSVSQGNDAPIKISQLGLSGGSIDLAARRAAFERVYAEGGQLKLAREKGGELALLKLLPKAGTTATASNPGKQAGSSAAPAAVEGPGAAWAVTATSVEVNRFSAAISDQDSGLQAQVNDFAFKASGASSDLSKSVKFASSLALREGGQFTADGNVVPGNGALQADVSLKQLALLPFQPLLSQHLLLKIASGNVSAKGRLTRTADTPAAPSSLRFAGSLDATGVRLNEIDGQLFAGWKEVAADRVLFSMAPNRLEIPDLRVVEPGAKLIIENDRSFNAARLLVRRKTPDVARPTPAADGPRTATDENFPVRVGRVRLQNANLDFTDLSLRPQFSAKIHDLNGVISGISSSAEARSQIQLDGEVDEFGLARIRGELNPANLSNNTALNVVFKNIDMVPASPYSMKFAGYQVAEGKISLDLQYKVQNGKLEGNNLIVIDKLTLGPRVDSPDALKLPLELAIALLKDSDGRIDLGLPVSGDLNDPQFSYGGLIWKAIGNLLTRIVTSPFRALGSLLGVGGDKLEAIDFDAGSGRLLPPEKEKLKQVAQLLAKRPQLKLSVAGQYSEAADGAALRARAVRMELARRTGMKLQPGEEPGPIDLSDRATRGALREFYAQRFGDAELDKQKKAAENEAASPSSTQAADGKPASAEARLPLLQRMGKLVQGEPQVADASAFYNKLRTRLEQEQALPADALTSLGAERARAIVAALTESGIDSTRAQATPSEKITSSDSKAVQVKLALGTN